MNEVLIMLEQEDSVLETIETSSIINDCLETVEMLGGEFRFLTPQHSGQIYAEGIADDRAFDESGIR